MAFYWPGIGVFVNLTSILWLGALAVNTVTGLDLTIGLIALGGMWIMNLSYWDFNRYIIQRALAARSAQEAQQGIMFAPRPILRVDLCKVD